MSRITVWAILCKFYTPIMLLLCPLKKKTCNKHYIPLMASKYIWNTILSFFLQIHIQRTEGCDHMTCAQCNTNFCYRCGERYRHLRSVYFTLQYVDFSSSSGSQLSLTWRLVDFSGTTLLTSVCLAASIVIFPVNLIWGDLSEDLSAVSFSGGTGIWSGIHWSFLWITRWG